jgi:hypothetical protein
MNETTKKIVKVLQEQRMDFCRLLAAGFKLNDINEACNSGHISCNIFGVYSPTIGG